MADDHSTVRERIITSLFRKTNDAGLLEDTYVGHLKIWEDVPPQTNQYTEENGSKPRYLMVSITADGQGHLYKGKRNSNDTYSIGKRWLLSDLRAIEVPERTSLWFTMNRVYKWRVEASHEVDLTRFVIAAAHLYERLRPGHRLQVTGITVPALPPLNGRSSQYEPSGRSAPSSNTAPLSLASSRRRPPVASSDADAPAVATSSPPLAPARPAFRPASSSSYGSAPGSSRGVNTMSTASNVPASIPPRTRTPVGSSLRASAVSTVGATRSPNVNAPPLPDDRAPPLNAVRSRPQSPQLPVSSSSNRPPEPSTLLTADRPERPRRGSHASSSHSIRAPPADELPRITPKGPPPKANGSSEKPSAVSPVDRIHAAERSFALSLDDLDAPFDDEYGFETTMSNVEEMVDGFEWSALDADSGSLIPTSQKGSVTTAKSRSRGAADQIQSRLQDELSALEKANIHSYLESDDRVLTVIKLIDETVAVIDDLDGYISSYKVQLNSVADDISYIQSRNRGLQVQTQNQSALLNEIDQLLSTVHVDVDKLLYLSQGSPQTDEGIRKLEEAAADLYKAMLAARETEGMAATMERLEEYRTYNTTFTTRLTQFLSVMFSAQAVPRENDPGAKANSKSGAAAPKLPSHAEMEAYVARYGGLVLYTRDMDEKAYAKICATYFSVASELHASEMKPVMTAYLEISKKGTDESDELTGFSSTATTGLSRMNTQIRRNNTVSKSPLDRKDKDRSGGGSMTVSEAFSQALGLLVGQIYKEENFIADFLQIHESNNNTITFADYMSLESYFRRQAGRTLVLGGATKQLIRGAMDLIFGFLPETIKVWIDGALGKDPLQLVGIIATLERFTSDAEERGNIFIQKLLQKQSQRMSSVFTKLMDDQIKSIEQTKLSTKKRRGVVNFIKYFPIFVGRLEGQLIGADQFEIRGTVDNAYEQIVQVMFESLQQMAKMSDGQDGGTEDKGILNFHVILIENMHYFIQEVAQQELGAMQGFLRRAQAIYDDNLSAYVKIVLRRPMGKILEFFEGVERLLKTTAPSQVSSNGSFNRSSLKRVVKDYSSKDMRRHVEALYKRVDKHFSLASEPPGGGATVAEEGSALQDVWSACQDELLKETDNFSRLLTQCYEGIGVSLEYTPTEVEQYFRAARRSR